MQIRRALLAKLSDAAYDTVQSFHSDSAICFAIFLHYLPDLTSQHNSYTLLKALEVGRSAFTPAIGTMRNIIRGVRPFDLGQS